MDKLNVAIVGATGMVGRTFLEVLEEMNLPIGNLGLFASGKSAGNKVMFKGQEFIIEELSEESLDPKRYQYALFSAGSSVSSAYGKTASQNGITVIDNSSFFRMEKEVPLIVPEINMEQAKGHKLISNPNCSTIQSVVPLKVIHDLFKVKRVVYTTYQAVSGSGQKGLEDLQRTQKGEEPMFYPVPIADNCIPHIDVFLEDGSTKEEQKMIEETRKILGDENLKVSATCVRVPVSNGHSVAMNVTCESEPDLNLLKKALKKAEGIVYYEEGYPTALDAVGQDKVLVGRLRNDNSEDNTISLWVVADNVRKGAASNAVQILKKL
ncbi:MAG TPA: aspartate-semialdehyde dehydrogenase, partial [Bacteroidales bacterium]|nr:aspartate-semialdehyde dehydrogenase [Bacteroidales bacterium]